MGLYFIRKYNHLIKSLRYLHSAGDREVVKLWRTPHSHGGIPGWRLKYRGWRRYLSDHHRSFGADVDFLDEVVPACPSPPPGRCTRITYQSTDRRKISSSSVMLNLNLIWIIHFSNQWKQLCICAFVKWSKCCTEHSVCTPKPDSPMVTIFKQKHPFEQQLHIFLFRMLERVKFRQH